MKKKYQVRFFKDDIYEVVEIVTILGERLSAYESEACIVEEHKVFQGELSDCGAYIWLKEGGYM